MARTVARGRETIAILQSAGIGTTTKTSTKPQSYWLYGSGIGELLQIVCSILSSSCRQPVSTDVIVTVTLFDTRDTRDHVHYRDSLLGSRDAPVWHGARLTAISVPTSPPPQTVPPRRLLPPVAEGRAGGGGVEGGEGGM